MHEREGFICYLSNVEISDDKKDRIIKELEIMIGIILDEQFSYNKTS